MGKVPYVQGFYLSIVAFFKNLVDKHNHLNQNQI